jgi:hypothetical protein
VGGVIVWKYCALLALFSSPAIPLAVAWRWLVKSAAQRRLGGLIPAAVATFSLLWFDTAMNNYRFFGPLQGLFHYTVTGGNLLAVLACSVFCLATGFRRGLRIPRLATAVACLMLAAEWSRLGIVYR